MGKLLQRLNDPARSGVYRAPHAGDVVDAVQGSALKVVHIGLAGVSTKAELMERFARSLAFPHWFGGNWDGLEDCLTDLSWSDAAGHVLLIEGAGGLASDERGILADVLASAAAFWVGRGRPFFAVFVGGEPPLPELYRTRK